MKTCGKCGSKIPEPGPCPVCEDAPFGVIRMKPRGWNRATPEERNAMEKGCTCQSEGFGVTPEEPCPYHSKPRYYSYALGEYGRVHFLIEMPSGWLVGIPESEMKDQMELQEPNPEQDKPYHTHTLVRPEETKEPDDEREAERGAAKAADALSKFMPFRHCPAPERNIPGLNDYADESTVVGRYQRCVVKLLEMFDKDPLPSNHPAQAFVERLEALIELNLIAPNEKVTLPAEDDGLAGQVRHIKDWLVSWRRENEQLTNRAWDSIHGMREEHGHAIETLTKRVDEICEVLKDLAKRGGGKPVELMRFK